MLGDTPAWANGGAGDDKRPPAPGFEGRWGEFCRQFAARDIPRGVTVFEVWNEPNLTRIWTVGPNTGDYVRRVLMPCSTGPRAAAAVAGASITIVTGGTAPATNGGNIDPRTWVTQLYEHGAQPHLDAIAHHPSTWPYPPNQNAAMAPSSFVPNQWNAMDQTLAIRSTMVSHGDRHRDHRDVRGVVRHGDGRGPRLGRATAVVPAPRPGAAPRQALTEAFETYG